MGLCHFSLLLMFKAEWNKQTNFVQVQLIKCVNTTKRSFILNICFKFVAIVGFTCTPVSLWRLRSTRVLLQVTHIRDAQD